MKGKSGLMDFQNILHRAIQIREQYAALELKNYGRTWSREEVLLGFVGDVGDFAKLALVESGVREIPDAKQKLAHELADCLWSLLVLSHLYNINLEEAFLQTMDELQEHIKSNLA